MNERNRKRYNDRNPRKGQGDPRRRYPRPPYNKKRSRYPKRSSYGRRNYFRRGTILYVLDTMSSLNERNASWVRKCQVLEVPSMRLYEALLNKNASVNLEEKVVITGTNDPIGKIQKRLKYSDLTSTAKEMLEDVIKEYILEHEEQFVNFINTAQPFNIKRHSLEELPGVGNKIKWVILEEREKEPFKNLEDIKNRVPAFRPLESLTKRFIEEIANDDLKHYILLKEKRKRMS